MKTKTIKNSGFTLVELLVVIVILGILGTIGFANFRGYFGRALNAERKAAVSNIASIVKIDQAADFSNTKYVYDLAGIQAALEADDYQPPSAKDAMCIWYGYTDGTLTSSTDNEFLVLTLLDEEDGPNGTPIYGFVDGASSLLDDARDNAADGTPIFTEANTGCSATPANVGTSAGTSTDWTWIRVTAP